MNHGIVTNWSETAPNPPFVTISISLICVFALFVYIRLSPVMQQAMIDMGGMQPATISALLGQGPATWGNVASLSIITSLFIHASWLHLLGSVTSTFQRAN